MKYLNITKWVDPKAVTDYDLRQLVFEDPIFSFDRWMYATYKLKRDFITNDFLVEDESLLGLFILHYSHYFTYNIYEE